jgi:hypothetical protein
MITKSKKSPVEAARRLILSAIASLGALAIAVGATPDDGSKMITFEAPGAGSGAGTYQGTGCFGCTFGINQWGVIAGTYLDGNNVYHGFIRRTDGSFRTFEVPGADTTPGSYNGTLAQSINDWGEVAGYYADENSLIHGFIFNPDGTSKSFDVPGAANGSVPVFIGDDGDVVGYSLDAEFLFHAFLRHPNGTFDVFLAPGSCTSGTPAGCYGNEATNIDRWGISVGNFADNSANLVQHGFIRMPDGKFTTFDVPGAGTGPGQGTGCPGCNLGFNRWGMIAGSYSDSNYVSHGFLREPDGEFHTFEAPGADTTPNSYNGTGCFSDCPVGLNDSGAVTGSFWDSSGVQHGFLRRFDGTFATIDPAGSTGTQPEAINDSGAIVGYYVDGENVYHGFLRLP